MVYTRPCTTRCIPAHVLPGVLPTMLHGVHPIMLPGVHPTMLPGVYSPVMLPGVYSPVMLPGVLFLLSEVLFLLFLVPF